MWFLFGIFKKSFLSKSAVDAFYASVEVDFYSYIWSPSMLINRIMLNGLFGSEHQKCPTQSLHRMI